ncbi:hypothetical protein E3T37_04265 [Cryobacterium sp. TMT2-10]|uniref:Uncharacterized protein n=1 Tax=Cryobacterium shii TaxID=1259235 RepID=A0AAQ2HF62_9MICO|nr:MULTISPECIES: hypothetical protein [Cryobacterium]TFC43424.1 hypothetical protein E3O49_13265 [Cryobacterium shii]TFC89592.1 hypothetical protein E3T24_00795 [Cryobacterium sp. TmT2-59]TFD14194.1 hypothetical protein E3T42_12005 [Cryobacterium sp. TMT4-10]TFD20224.1 hypothetical protein E3T32_09330 [Cryobacterium sp. TMT2-23]TFD41296.1 hypothetical protein E3T37_04265 [Cryobacterium sp. TMT2-10]
MTLTSPRGHILRILEGSASDVDSRGRNLVALGDTMDSTARALREISEGTTQIAESVDKVRKVAGEINGDLSKAAVRYRMTGETLKGYAAALKAAQDTIHPLIDDIETAHSVAEDRRDTADSASRALSGLDTTWLWETEPTPQDRAQAVSADDAAASSARSADNNLDGLWDTFESAFSVWAEAYDDAVGGIDTAMDTAGNNDTWVEDLTKFLDTISSVLLVLAVVALFLTGPIALFVMALVVVLSVVSLIGHVTLAATGNGSWVDVGLDVFGLVTFGIGAAGAKSVSAVLRGPEMRAVFAGGRDSVQVGLRAAMPTSNWRLVNRFRDVQAFAGSRLQTIPPFFNNPWNTLRGGSANVGQYMGFRNNIDETFGHLPEVAEWVRGAGREGVPVLREQVKNVALSGGGTLVAAYDKIAGTFDQGYISFKNSVVS